MPKAQAGSYQNWTHEEVRLLLLIRTDREIDRQMNGKCSDTPALEKISCQLKEHGHNRTASQVKTKLKNLKKKFMAVKLANKTSGQKRQEMEFYDLCFEIWGQTAAAEPVNIVSSSSTSPSVPGSGSASSLRAAVQAPDNINDDTSQTSILSISSVSDGEDSDHITDDDDDDEVAAMMKLAESLENPQPPPRVQQGSQARPRGSTTSAPPATTTTTTTSTSAGNGSAEEARPPPRREWHPRDQSGAPPKKKKKTKVQESMQAVSAALTTHFNDAEERQQQSEDRRIAAQREWEERLEERQEQAQRNLMREMNQQTTSLISGLWQMMTQFQSQPQPAMGQFNLRPPTAGPTQTGVQRHQHSTHQIDENTTSTTPPSMYQFFTPPQRQLRVPHVVAGNQHHQQHASHSPNLPTDNEEKQYTSL
ncbi:nuclear transcription factor Y subunit beta-like [Lytechinus variegatus]|uniref:nuclear transcription factor Y subunit beta-like n=1 Tax=Lytechinus variegatus TaxID=7654 RepID=UPI001BB2C2C5|nr:nuclear transcription factor Y subunit beta-like [Lytechinus variegatus]